LQKRTLIILIAAIALIFAASCSDDPAKPTEEDNLMWPAMTSRDDVIKTVMIAYANRTDGASLSKYNALLHTEYFFGLAAEDVSPGDPPILTRAEDIASTEFLFDPTTTSVLELTITPEEGSWYEYPEIEGQPCENCYVTERQYFIRAQFGDEMTIYQSPPGRAFAVFIVAPDESDASKWVLRAAFDLGI
jgi:hypothetical protein